MSTWGEYILSHENDDVDRMLLSSQRCEGIDLRLAADTILCRRKMRTKVPQFYACPQLIYPSRLCAEQCSSQETALSKVELIRQLALKIGKNDLTGQIDDLRIADLTGGLGVDCYFFSFICEKVLHNEMNLELSTAAKHNFKALGRDNILTANFMVVPADSVVNAPTMSREATNESAKKAKEIEVSKDGQVAKEAKIIEKAIGAPPREILGDFSPQIIFLDPARRDSIGKKVFLLEDCSPDILRLKDELLSICRFVVVKLSPMADTDMVAERLGPHCSLIQIISVRGECRELLAVLDREHNGECTIEVKCLRNTECTLNPAPAMECGLKFTREEERLATALQASTPLSELSGWYLLEPDKALMKAAPFKLLCQRFGIQSMDPGTHYYLLPPQDKEKAGALSGLFKIFEIIEALPLDKRNIKLLQECFPKAEVTARNIPISSEELRNKLKVRPSDDYHIFGLKYLSQKSLFACRKCLP